MTGSLRASPPDRRIPDRKAEVDADLTRLHGRQDCAYQLSALHEEAADHFAKTEDERRFHLTHAWVYALVDGHDARVTSLERLLKEAGGLT